MKGSEMATDEEIQRRLRGRDRLVETEKDNRDKCRGCETTPDALGRCRCFKDT